MADEGVTEAGGPAARTVIVERFVNRSPLGTRMVPA
jgi:hypothetical protein